MKVSIIVPVYNELHHIEEVLERISSATFPENVETELIIVDDGSTDGTTDVLNSIEKRGSTVKVHSSMLNFGKGTAIRIGLKYVSGDVVLIQDGDLEYDPNDYGKLLQPFLENHTDVVYGSRFALSKPQGMKLPNYIANKILTFTANVLYGAKITDEATAYKAFTAKAIRSIDLSCKRFEFCPEITAKIRKKGYQIKEVPISYNARGIAEGKKIRWQDGFVAIWTLLKYRFMG